MSHPTPTYIVSSQSSEPVHASHTYTGMTVLEKQCPYVENKNMSTATPMRYTRVSGENKPTLRENNQGMVLA